MAPGEPHLLAGCVERYGQTGQDPVLRAEGFVLKEYPRLGVHERRSGAVLDGNPLGGAGRAGGEDDPRVVVRFGRASAGERGGRFRRGSCQAAARAQYRCNVCLAEDQPGALVRVIGVNRHIRGAHQEDGKDGDVEFVGPGRDAHADFIPGAKSGQVQPPCGGAHFSHQL